MSHSDKFLAMCVKNFMHQDLISINEAKLHEVAAQVPNVEHLSWDWELPLCFNSAELLWNDGLIDVAYYMFVTTSLQYCYWNVDESGVFTHWCYNGNSSFKGSTGMARMMIDQYELGKFPGFHLNYQETRSHYKNLFCGQNMPDATRRAEILASLASQKSREIFAKLMKKACVKAPRGWCFDFALAMEVAFLFPKAYADPFYKKALLFLGMLHGHFSARTMNVTGKLYPYADYRLPQVLRHLGVLKYGADLEAVVDQQILLNECGDIETVIRSVTIVAMENLVELSGKPIHMVDAYLFEKTREESFNLSAKPFHLCQTRCY